MSKLNIDDLLSALNEAAMVARRISEKQHIDNLKNYFNEDGTPIVKSFTIGQRQVDVPLYILADHSSIGLDELEIDFEARLYFDEHHGDSEIKKFLLGDTRNGSIGAINLDSGKKGDNLGTSKLKVKFKKDQRPEAVSRLIDDLIQRMDDTSIPIKPKD